MGARSWLLRRAMGRLRIDDDIVRHLSTFQRLGERLEVELPTEVLPVGARTVFRALRTRAAPQIAVDWVWPHWLERQIDPENAAFIPRGHLPFLTNLTRRNWTAVGSVSSPWVGIVDPRGLVTPWYDGWSLDWWVGADDGWHLPSRAANVTQTLFEGTPIPETSMPVPGGKVTQRVHGAVVDGDEVLVVEIHNDSPTPVALAVGVRPYNPEGLAVVERIDLRVDGAGATVTVDGRAALHLPGPPHRSASSTFRDGDSAATVMAGDATEGWSGAVRCDAGLAQAAFVYPLTHRTTQRFVIPMGPPPKSRRRGVARRRAARHIDPRSAPPSESAASGWVAQRDRAMRLELPAGRLADAIDANRAYLLLFHDGDEVTPGPATYHRFWFRDAAYLLAAMGRYGYRDEAAQVLATYGDRQRVDGFFFSQRKEWDSNGAALFALADHWRLFRDRSVLDGNDLVIAKGVAWIERKRDDGLLPAGISAEHLGPHDQYFWDDLWCWRGLRDAVEMLEVLDQPEAAAEARAAAEALGAVVRAELDHIATRRGDRVMPAGPRRAVDPGIIGCLVACDPLELMSHDDPAIAETAQMVRDRFTIGDAFYQGIAHTGLGTYLTLQLAFVEMRAGDRKALDRLAWMLDSASPTYTWPEAVHPRLGGGCMGDGHHGWAAADFLRFCRDLLVRETDDGLALVSMPPDEWWGEPLAVHDAPTHRGRLSFGIRWHGARPALLWELVPHDGDDRPVTITCPGFDPSWSTTELAGEALLDPPPGFGPAPS